MIGKRGRSVPCPEEDPNSIGNLAVELRFITEETLKKAIRTQKERMRLGEILLDMKVITSDQLAELLFEQRLRRGEASREEIRKFERIRQQRGLRSLTTHFQEAAESVRGFTTDLQLMAAKIDGHR